MSAVADVTVFLLLVSAAAGALVSGVGVEQRAVNHEPRGGTGLDAGDEYRER
jgi:hypothetical protein